MAHDSRNFGTTKERALRWIGIHGREAGMTTHVRGVLVLALVVALAGCGQAPEGTETTATSPTAPSEPTASPTIQDIEELGDFAPLEPGTYFIDPDADPATPLRVVYEVPVEGWSEWAGAAKFATDGHVGVSITTVTNVVGHGCRDHSPGDPPIGPAVDDLATALSDLAPFEVTSPPRDMSIDGYTGKHLELRVPDIPVEGEGDTRQFARCIDGNLESWISPHVGGFSGYTGPGYREEFWILDVEGTRLMIAANRSPGSPPEDLAERQAILDSIRIEP
jgi:hypothetical protein